MPLRGKKNIPEETEDKAIEISAQMQGSLSFNDPVNLKINGNFKGSLETKGTLTIGESGHVEANITGDNIVLGGKVTGDIYASKMLVLMPTAVLQGNITTPKLNIVEGAIFQGKCQMIEDAIEPELLDMKEVARQLEIDIPEIEQLAESGKIPATRVGNSWKFEQSQIDNWAASNKVNS